MIWRIFNSSSPQSVLCLSNFLTFVRRPRNPSLYILKSPSCSSSFNFSLHKLLLDGLFFISAIWTDFISLDYRKIALKPILWGLPRDHCFLWYVRTRVNWSEYFKGCKCLQWPDASYNDRTHSAAEYSFF